MYLRTLFTAIVCASLIGCGGAVSDDPIEVTPPSQTESLKAALNDVAQTGQLGSGGMTIEQGIEELKATDAAKADALKKDYEELKNMSDPNRAKAKAKEMAGKL